MKTEELLSFYRWMRDNGWEEHSSGRYFYRLAFRSQWPPEEKNCATGEQLIEKWKAAIKSARL